VNALLTLAGGGHSLYRSARAQKILEEIQESLRDVYTDNAESHFQSAADAFAAARHSRSPNEEIRDAIAHLRDAFNIVQPLLMKTKTKGILFFAEVVPVIDEENRRKVRARLFEIATAIAVTYADLREKTNGRAWKRKALDYLDDYCDEQTAFLTPTYLREHVSKRLVEQRSSTGCEGTMSHVRFTTSTWYILSDAGKQYLTRQRARIAAAARKAFAAKGL